MIYLQYTTMPDKPPEFGDLLGSSLGCIFTSIVHPSLAYTAPQTHIIAHHQREYSVVVVLVRQ
jgi:hypothetical protein